MNRHEELKAIFDKVDEDKRSVVLPLLDEVVFMEQRLNDLRNMPQIRVHPNDAAKQEITAAGKMYKETMQAYNNTIKILLSTLSRYSVEEKDAFDEWLAQNDIS